MPTCRVCSNCRLCDSARLEAVCTLSSTPLANDFQPASTINEIQELYPLELMLCVDCGHLQLGHIVDPESLFSDYVYVSGTSPSFVAHFDAYAETIWRKGVSAQNDLVVDIGSNDGTLLNSFRRLGARIQGIDPAQKIANAANEGGVPTISAFFSSEIAAQIIEKEGHARIITANNVCAHIDDIGSVVDAVVTLLAPDGLFVFEVSYLQDVIEKTLFDTIYHEHLDYHALRPLVPFLQMHGLHLFHAERISSHGGSIRVFAAPKASGRRTSDELTKLLAAEDISGLSEPGVYENFFLKIQNAGNELSRLIATASAKGRRIAGYGAPAKATTLMYQFGLKPKDLAYIVDDSPWKQGLYSPGLNIPVVPASRLIEDPVDDLLILAWNFAESIIENNRQFLHSGNRFIVPLPTLKVVSGDNE
jgi:SAM-dependent methyltransferase